MIKLGTGNVTLYLGDKKVKAAWLGSEKVYPNSFLELSASSLSFAAAGQTQQLAITVNDGQAWTIAALPAGFSASVTSGTGPTSVTITAANNTSETTRTGALTVNSEDLSAACSLSQTAGAKVYGGWQNVRLETEGNITSFAAGGGTAKIHMVVERTWTWNGVAGSGGTETNWSQPANVTVSDAIASVAADVLTIGSLGTTFKAATQITIEAGTASDSGTNNRKTLAITQAANYVTSINSLKTRTLTYSQIGAGGGTSNCQWDSYLGTALNTLWSCTFASGATGNATDADAVGNFRDIGMSYSWNGPSGTITSLNGTTGAITAISRGTTVGNAITVTVNAIQNVVFDNPSFVGGSTTPVLQQQATGTCTQEGNAVTNTTQSGGVYTYGNVTAGAITNATIPASGGSATATAGNGSQSWSRTAIIATDTYTSGSTAQRTIQGATNGTNTVAPSRTSLSGTAGSKGQVTSGQTTVQSATVTWSANGKSASGTMYVYQQENKFIRMTSNCSGYTRYGVREYTSGSYEYSEQNSYYCGYRVTVALTVSIMQSGIMREPVFKSLQAWSCRTENFQGQGSSTVTFRNPKFGINTATLELSESEKNYGYVLFQLSMTYTDSGGAGVTPNYVWSNAVTYSGSLAIYTKANANNANVTVSAATRSLSLQEDASNLLAQAESAGIELPDEIKSELSAIAEGKE